MNNETKELNSILELMQTSNYNKTTGMLIIPEGTECINGKFYYKKSEVNELNKIKQVMIPNSVKRIGKYAFRKTGITKLEFYDSIQEIDLGAFELCEDLYEIKIIGNKIPIIEKDAFLVCNNLERFYNNKGDIDIENDIRISKKAFCTSPKLINNQNKWLLVVDEKQNKFALFMNKFIKAIDSLLKLNGAERIHNKF